MTREGWLMKVVDAARPLFAEAGATLPSVRVSLCPPQRKMKAIGLCWHAGTCEDDAREIWVSSTLKDPVDVAATLIHELCHACLPNGVGHGKPFKDLAAKMGLAGPAKATYASDDFKVAWAKRLEAIGPMPGAAFAGGGEIVGKRKQPSKPKKNVTCPDCGFFAKVLVEQMEMGRLVCPVDGEMLLTKEEGGE